MNCKDNQLRDKSDTRSVDQSFRKDGTKGLQIINENAGFGKVL